MILRKTYFFPECSGLVNACFTFAGGNWFLKLPESSFEKIFFPLFAEGNRLQTKISCWVQRDYCTGIFHRSFALKARREFCSVYLSIESWSKKKLYAARNTKYFHAFVLKRTNILATYPISNLFMLKRSTLLPLSSHKSDCTRERHNHTQHDYGQCKRYLFRQKLVYEDRWLLKTMN